MSLKIASLAIAMSLMSISTMAHQVKEEPAQSYRQSYFALIGANFGAIVQMVKGEVSYDNQAVIERANNLVALASIDVTKAFPEGSEQGTTRAKPEIWQNRDDFASKFEAMGSAVNKLAQAQAVRADVAKAVGAVGESCKGCHDDYKAKDYLY